MLLVKNMIIGLLMDFQTFNEHLRRALNHLYDPDFLRRSPLASVLEIDGRSNTPLAMQEKLIAAIAGLHSPQTDPVQHQEMQAILQYRYVEQFTQDEIALQLGVSTRQLRRKQKKALELLAWTLWESPEPEAAPSNIESNPPILAESLAWLEQATHNQQTDLLDLMQSVRELSHPLTRKHNTRLLIRHDLNLPAIVGHPMAVRQSLLSYLNALIVLSLGHTITIHVRAEGAFFAEIHIRTQLPLNCDWSKLAAAESIAKQLLELGGGNFVQRVESGNVISRFRLPTVGSIHVLVIDDNADIFQFIERASANTRFRLSYLPDASRVFASIETDKPDAIVLDIMLPDVDGMELLGRLREHPRTHEIPIIICSILPQESMVLALGARAFIGKPIDRNAFLDALNQIADELM